MELTTLKQYKMALVGKSLTEVCELVMAPEDATEGKVHPAIERMLKGQQPSDVDLLHEWRDDHLPCFTVSITYPDETYVLSLLWSTPKALIDLTKSIHNNFKCIQFAKDLMPED